MPPHPREDCWHTQHCFSSFSFVFISFHCFFLIFHCFSVIFFLYCFSSFSIVNGKDCHLIPEKTVGIPSICNVLCHRVYRHAHLKYLCHLNCPFWCFENENSHLSLTIMIMGVSPLLSDPTYKSGRAWTPRPPPSSSSSRWQRWVVCWKLFKY